MSLKSLTFALLASAMLVVPAGAQEIVLRSSDTHPDGYPTVLAVQHIGELVEQRSNGRLGIEVFHSAQLGQEKDTIEQTRFGVIDMNRISLAPFNGLIPETAVISLPYLFRDVDHMRNTMDGEIGKDIAAAFEAYDLVALAFYDSGARSFYNSRHPVRTLEDLKGLKFRVIQSDVYVDMTNALGANATPMPYGEVYSSIQTGVVDGAENNWPSYESSGHYEVAKYYTLDQHVMAPEVLVVSKMSWERLSAEDQQLLRDAAAESVPFMRTEWEKREAASQEKVRAAGVEVIEQIDKQPFIDAMAPVYEKYVTTDALKALVERIKAVE